jgi:hypothetical protein
MKVITGKTKAWLSEYGNPDALMGTPEQAVKEVCFSMGDMTSVGWSFVGDATVTFECGDRNELIANKVDSLRKEIKTVRAEAQMKAKEIEQKIQKLLAIEYTPEAP